MLHIIVTDDLILISHSPRITDITLPARERIHVVSEGDPAAPAVFLSHSILSSHAMWDTQAALLASRGWQVAFMPAGEASIVESPWPRMSARTIPPALVCHLRWPASSARATTLPSESR
ncbi:hypothetical protein [Cupriavidus sp. YAF13]|uniref:hypothetical protein n=1 Tax=Cupriavidus sp. YAF13 TaxID=3233075 RepID=UPI003F91D991